LDEAGEDLGARADDGEVDEVACSTTDNGKVRVSTCGEKTGIRLVGMFVESAVKIWHAHSSMVLSRLARDWSVISVIERSLCHEEVVSSVKSGNLNML
jgi:hypothetical protein